MEKSLKGKNELYYYLYKITNLINNKFYIGVHSTNNLNDGYMGSGQIIKIAIKKYGIENFKKEILEYFDTPEDMFNKEHEIVNESLINDPNCYNITLGGKGNKKNYVYAYDINENVYYVLKNDKRFKTGELRYKLLIVDNENNKKWIFNDDPKYLSGEYKSILSDYVSVKDKDNNNLRVSKNDSRYLSGELKFN